MRYILSISFTLFALWAISTSMITQHAVHGVVQTETGTPIVGASVTEKNTRNTVATAVDGSFIISVSSKRARLVVGAPGYDTQEFNVPDSKKIKVVLKLASRTGVLYTPPKIVADSELKEDAATPSVSYMLQGVVSGYSVEKSAPRQAYNNTMAFNTEDYDAINENRFHSVSSEPLSTFSIDVDAASYSNMRRFVTAGNMPPPGAVRIEEMINYFHYEYPQPLDDKPFSVTSEISVAPWNSKHQLVRIGLQGKKIPVESLPASNLVFLIDVSGSMMPENKLPLVRSSLKMLVDQMREKDRVAIVVYAGSAGLVLPSTSGDQKMMIKSAIDRLEAGGSTAGGEGIRLAYKIAMENFISTGNNRVILCTDGDFNIGESSDASLENLITDKRKSNIFLTVLGYGMGNYKDNKMQKLADKGNGNHAYIDGLNEAKKVLVNEFGGTLFTIAKDVKLQVEFNPAYVQSYRLIGYENRMLNKEDFNDDKKDAGELGSGHNVTALYEIIPAGVSSEFSSSVDPLKYQLEPTPRPITPFLREVLTVKLRYKDPTGDKSKLLEHRLEHNIKPIRQASQDLRFAASVAEFGMLLSNSAFKQGCTYEDALMLANQSLGEDKEGYRKEFVELIRMARSINTQARK